MKNCCKTDEKPSMARKIYNIVIMVLLALLFLGVIISILLK